MWCVDDDAMEETVDLLDPAQSRKLAKAAAGQETRTAVSEPLEESAFELPVNSDGKLVIDVRLLSEVAHFVTHSVIRIKA